MGKFTTIYATFFAPDDLTTPLSSEGATSWIPVEGYGVAYLNATGDMSVTFPNDTALNTVAAVGNICWVRAGDLARLADFPNGWTLIEPFVIRSRVAGPEQNMITIGGQDFLSELARFTIYRPLGAETITNTTVLAGHNAAAPVSRTLGASAPAGVDSVILDATTGGAVGCEIRITMDGGAGTHVTVVTEVEPGGTTNAFRILDRLPANATSGNAVEFRTRQFRVTNPAPFLEGVECHVTLNDASTHSTLIAESPGGDTGDVITLRDGLEDGANAGNAVQAKDYSQPSTDDVTTVMSYAQGFSVGFQTGTGTAAGTRYAGGGETVYDILRAIADETGEYFRFATADAPTIGPKRRVIWRRTADVAGVDEPLKLVLPAPGDVQTDYANVDRGILISKPRHAGHYDPITQIIPVAGDPRVTLYSCSAAALSAAAGDGYTVVTTGLGLYAAPYVKDGTLDTAIGVHQRRVSFSEVTVEGDNSGSIQSAADKLLRMAIAYMKRHKTPERSIEVEFVTSLNVLPGNSVEMEYTDPTGVYSINYSDPTPLIVQSVRRSFSNSGDYPGVPITYCELSTSQIDSSAVRNPQTADVVGKRLKAVDRLLAQVNTPRLATLAVPGSGGTPPVIGVTDHGALTGLADNDHTQYLTGVTDTSLAKTGQTLGVNLKASNSELEISSGLGVLTTSNAKTTVSRVLKGDASGDITLRQLTADKVIAPELETASGDITLDPASGKTINDGNLEFTGARSLTTSSGSLTLAPTAGLILDPADDAINVAASASLKTANWASGFLGTGWGVTYAGAADFRSIYADELHVAAFIADTARVKVGAEYITPSMAIISRNFTIPAVSSTGTLYVEDAPGLDDLPVFADNDWLLLRIIDRPAGGLNVLNVWGQVSGYTNQADGEQSWTFTTRSAGAAAVGEAARRGGVALDFGKSGDGWIVLTTLDTAGSPYLGITQWQGSDPYTGANRSHKLRLGQLQGVSGLHEWGLQAGQATSNFIRFSDLRSEIHGTRFSLYAGDGGQLRVTAARVIHYRAAGSSSNLAPNADHTVQGVLSTGGSYYTEVDENPGSPTTSDYLYNGTNQSGVVFLGLGNPTWTGITYQCNIQCHIIVTGLTNDAINLYGQVFASDEMTPLTSEKLIYAATSNTAGTTPNVQCDTVVTSATQAQWNGARLRLRWEYAISASDETIRLDPNVPSIAVGATLPTGYSAGGTGLWTGNDGGTYKLRIGEAGGESLRWTGSALEITNSAGEATIVMDGSGSRFDRPMALGTNGGIWQGTGGSPSSFSNPYNGLKIWNESGEGRLAMFYEGDQMMALRYDRGLELSQNSTPSVGSYNAISFAKTPGGTVFGGLNIYGVTFSRAELYVKSDNAANSASLRVAATASGSTVSMVSGSASFAISQDSYALLSGVDLYVREKGLAVGYNTTPSLNRGQIASDFAGEHDYNALVLQDTGDISHGMTSVVGDSTYGALGKVVNASGGLQVLGATEGQRAINITGYSTTANTTKGVTGNAAVYVNAFLKSGTTGGSMSANANLFAVGTNDNAKLIVDTEGDLHIDGTTASFDTFDDVALLRAADLTLAGHDIDRDFGAWLEYNRADLARLGLVSEGGFVNVTRMQRLITGAIHQIGERLSRLEAAVHG